MTLEDFVQLKGMTGAAASYQAQARKLLRSTDVKSRQVHRPLLENQIERIFRLGGYLRASHAGRLVPAQHHWDSGFCPYAAKNETVEKRAIRALIGFLNWVNWTSSENGVR